jgi:phosphoglycerate dehydrogenase-like enzyme
MAYVQAPRIALGPARVPEWMRQAVVDGGGEIVDFDQAEALVWGAPRDAVGLSEVLATHSSLKWIQLPFAGIENFVHLVDSSRLWTCGKGVYAEPVAEMALSLMLAGLRGLGTYARRTTWSGPIGRNLHQAQVAILGGGGITEALVRLLKPFDCHITVVRHRVVPMEGVAAVWPSDRYAEALLGADVVVLALPLTKQTEGIIGRSELESMSSHTWLINVARGGHIVTDDLVHALQEGIIGGVALDVTDPEPLPDDHPLWGFENCIITPHVANTPEMAVPLLSERIRVNVRRWADGEELLGPVFTDLGY